VTSHFLATAGREFSGQGLVFKCAIGKGGMVDARSKTEGDGASPVGVWEMRRVFWRPDRLSRPDTGLLAVPLRPDDGWCDDPADPLYNRPVRTSYPASHERLWRDDHVYDIIVELSHNQAPVIAGAGSAIFFHLARANYEDTEGCIALDLPAMLQVLAKSRPGTTLEICA